MIFTCFSCFRSNHKRLMAELSAVMPCRALLTTTLNIGFTSLSLVASTLEFQPQTVTPLEQHTSTKIPTLDLFLDQSWSMFGQFRSQMMKSDRKTTQNSPSPGSQQASAPKKRGGSVAEIKVSMLACLWGCDSTDSNPFSLALLLPLPLPPPSLLARNSFNRTLTHTTVQCGTLSAPNQNRASPFASDFSPQPWVLQGIPQWESVLFVFITEKIAVR